MKEKQLRYAFITCKCDLTCAKVRSFTSISSRTDLGVAPKPQQWKEKNKERGKENMSQIFFSKFLFFFSVIEDGKKKMNRKGERRREKFGNDKNENLEKKKARGEKRNKMKHTFMATQ